MELSYKQLATIRLPNRDDGSLDCDAHVFKRPTDPSRKSKGVDISHTTDMLSNAFMNNYDAALLIAGDADDIPSRRYNSLAFYTSCDCLRAAVSVRPTLELGVTGSHQNAPTASDARGPILTPSANHRSNIAGGVFCHADVRVGELRRSSAGGRAQRVGRIEMAAPGRHDH
jgi:hypothetical protein